MTMISTTRMFCNTNIYYCCPGHFYHAAVPIVSRQSTYDVYTLFSLSRIIVMIILGLLLSCFRHFRTNNVDCLLDLAWQRDTPCSIVSTIKQFCPGSDQGRSARSAEATAAVMTNA